MASSKLHRKSYLEEMLTCSICLELVTEPQIVTKCLHNCCTKCIEQLVKSQKNQPPGVVCPVCSRFSEERDIRRNHSVNDLLDQHKANLEEESQASQNTCDQCLVEKPGTVAVWKCLDCLINLCDTCKAQHLSLPLHKGHRILELSEEAESVIDHPVFCPTHHDEPIEFYCNECEEAVCNTCQVINHEGHDIVTAQNALDRLRPDIDQDLNSLDEFLSTIDQGVEQFDAELEEVETNFKQCSDVVDKEIEDRIGKLRKQQQNMKADLANKKQAQRSLIEDNKNTLINKRKEIANLRNFTRTSLELARPTSLLNELVNRGLSRRLKEVTKQTGHQQRLSIKKPALRLNARQWIAFEDVGLVGDLVYTTVTVLDVDGVKVSGGVNAAVSRYWPGIYLEFFGKPLKQTLEIKLPFPCQKITVCDDKIWAPIYHKNVIHIYTCDGELLKSVEVESEPSCVEKTSTGEMLVSCAKSGLFVLSDDGDSTVKVASGSYTSVCVWGDSVYTCDTENKQIVEFVKEDGDWRQKSVIPVDWLESTRSWDTLLVRRCGEDLAQLEFIICTCYQHTMYQVNSQGDKIRQFGSWSGQGDAKLMYPWLCGVDRHGGILVADEDYGKYKLLDTVAANWRTVITARGRVYNATMEGENTVWLSWNTGFQPVITKHEVIL